MANIDFFKNPDSYEVYVTVKFGIWKVAEISRFPSPADILYGNIINIPKTDTCALKRT